jgi:hypothetical protein
MHDDEPIEVIESPAHFEQGKFVEHQTIKVYIDLNAENPRTETYQDNFGHMVCFHQRYTLGDQDHGINKNDVNSLGELEEYLIREKGAIVILPLYLYEHSGITMSTGSFNDRWDSGQVGFIYATRKDILDNWGGQRVGKTLKEKTVMLLKAEVQEYDDYLTGNVYGYVIEDEGGEEVWSCWGYYGDTAIDYIKSELHIHPAKPVASDGASAGVTGEA